MTTTGENSSTTTTVEGWDSNTTNQTPSGTIDLTNYVTKDEYINAQSFGTKSRQNEIAMATKLVEKDSSELHKIEDIKLKDAITKQLLNMTYAEANAVMGNNFSISTTTNEDNSSKDNSNLSEVEKQLRLLQYKEWVREKESALSIFKSQNPELFAGDADAMVLKIEKELEFVSSSLPMDERIKRAASASLGNPSDKQSLAYQLLLNAQAWTSRGATSQQDEANTKKERIREEIREFLKRPKTK